MLLCIWHVGMKYTFFGRHGFVYRSDSVLMSTFLYGEFESRRVIVVNR